jgi:hypothetical protein
MNTLTSEEQERAAYMANEALVVQLLTRIIELEAENNELREELDNSPGDTLADWEMRNGPADSYKEFFSDCFEHLAGHYPCPSVSSDYDKGVIFDAISKGEGGGSM